MTRAALVRVPSLAGETADVQRYPARGSAYPTPETRMIPGDWLASLAMGVKLSAPEWRVVALVLAAPGPLSARRIAARLGFEYGRCKRIVRGLLAWRILERSPEGLTFQADTTRWGPPAFPPGKSDQR